MANLNALLLFAQVVESGSLSEAARRLDMPVSTVSRQIAELEAELGVRLLERTTRLLNLTSIGSEIFAQARIGADISDGVESLISEHQGSVSGLLRLAAPPSIADSLLAPLLKHFTARFPQARFDALITERAIDLTADGVDVAVIVGSAREDGLVIEPVLRYRHALVATPEYVRKNRAPAHPQELLERPIAAFSYWNRVWEWTFTHERGERRVISFAPQISMNDCAGLAELLLTGAIIGDLPPIVRPSLRSSGALIEVMPEWRFPELHLSYAYKRRPLVPRLIREFVAFASAVTTELFPDLAA